MLPFLLPSLMSSAALAVAQPPHRIGPCFLYPAAATSAAVNPLVTQANINDTICKSGWTGTIRPPSSYTDGLKKQQLASPRFKDKAAAYYEEDHFISLERAGVPRSVAMRMTGHKTESVYRRYAIVSDADLREAAAKLAQSADEAAMGTKTPFRAQPL